MDDLISRKRLLDSANALRRERAWVHAKIGVGDMEQLIRIAPTVNDMASVVHCKDCAHTNPNMRTPAGSHWCKCLERFMDDSFYCAYGRKKG